VEAICSTDTVGSVVVVVGDALVVPGSVVMVGDVGATTGADVGASFPSSPHAARTSKSTTDGRSLVGVCTVSIVSTRHPGVGVVRSAGRFPDQ
jgi:hypothetical protein